MAEDRGGLRYPITVENRFSGPLRDFRNQVDAARKSFKRFKGELSGTTRNSTQLKKNLQGIATASERLSKAERKANDTSKKRRKRIRDQEAATRKLLKQTKKLRATQVGQAGSLRVERVAVDRLTSAYKRLATAKRLAGIASVSGGVTAGAVVPPAAPTGGGRSNTASNLAATTAAANRATKAGNSMLFTFRRLFGVLAAFTIAREAAQGIAAMVRQMIEFNRVVETAQLGIASLITASSDVRDAIGGTVNASQRLALAQKEAAKQTALLRRDGLKTAATFEELVDTFQVAVGPGLAAGLDLDQIRRFTVQISQAASAAGVAQNQLSEEIRSILSGTIQQRTTRLAAVLGITNEDIRRVKEAGTLFEFLQERFGAFTTAGEAALNTFTAVLSNAKDAVSQLLGAGGLEFFESLKSLLKDVQAAAVTEDEMGVLQPNPQAVSIISDFAAGLRAAAEEAQRLTEAFNFEDLKQVSTTIGSGLVATAKVIGELIEGFIKGASDLADIVDVISNLVGVEIFDEGTVAAVARVATLVGGIYVAVSAMSSIILFLAANPLVAMAALFVVSLATIKHIVEEISGVQLSWMGFIRVMGASILRVFTEVGALAELVGTAVKQAFIIAGKAIVLFVKDAFLATVEAYQRALSVFSDDFKQKAEETRKEREKLLEVSNKEIENEISLLKLAGRRYQAIRKIAKEEQRATNIEAINDERGLDHAVEEFSKLFDKLKTKSEEGAVEQAASEFTNLNTIIDNLRPTLGRVNRSLDAQSKELEKIRAASVKADQALLEQRATLGLTGSTEKQRLLIVKAQARIRRANAVTIREEVALQKDINKLAQQQTTIKGKIYQLSEDDQFAVANGVSIARERFALDSKRLDLLEELAEQERKIGELADGPGAAQAAALASATKAAAATKAEIAKVDTILQETKDTADDLFEGLDPKKAEELGKIIAEQLQLSGREAVLLEQKQAKLERRLQTERLIGDQLAKNITLSAREAAQQLGPQIQRAEAVGPVETARVELGLLEQTQALAADKTRLTLEDLEAQRARLISQQATTDDLTKRVEIGESIRVTEEAILAVQTQQGLEIFSHRQELQKTADELLRIENLSGENGFFAGLGEAAREQLASLPQAFETTLGLINGIVASFSSNVSSLIIDAFDPSKEVDLRQRFAEFLQDIMRMVIQTLIQIAVTKAVLGLIGSAFGGPAGGAAGTAAGSLLSFGLAEGGPIPGRPAPAAARPSGLHPTDTVPIWAAPGEFMQKASAVSAYGMDVMRAINDVAIDPYALKSLVRPRPTRGRVPRLGFASGGAITGGGKAAAAAPSPAFVVADDQNLERMLSGGRGALLDFLQTNSRSVNAALGRAR